MEALVERSKTDISELHELDEAPLHIIFPYLKDLWCNGQFTVENREIARRKGEEKDFLEMETRANRNPDYLAKAYPIARDILMSHSDFEWTLKSELERMTYDLNNLEKDERQWKQWVEAKSSFSGKLGFAALIPGDGAFRIIGPCLFSPYHPQIDHGDALEDSPAEHARKALSAILKKRYGEDLPEDIEAARAWWKANEQRFAEKGDKTKSPNAPNNAFPPGSQNKTASPPKAHTDDSSARSVDSHSEASASANATSWLTIAGVLAALLVIGALFLIKRR